MKQIRWGFIVITVISVLFMFSIALGIPGYEIDITITGNGTVNKNPDYSFYLDENVTLTAVPDAGWEFTRWEGDLSGSTNPETIYVDDTKYVTAVFEKIPNPSTNLLLLDNE